MAESADNVARVGSGGIGEIYCTREEFQALRREPLLLHILEFARIVNQLRYHQVAVTQHSLTPPSADRQRMSAFLLFTGHLHEAMTVIRRMPEQIRELPEYSALDNLLKDPEWEKMKSFIRRLRDKTAFHFDPEVMRDGVERIVKDEDRDEYVFAVLSGRSKGEAYFKLADEAAFSFLAPEGKSSVEALMPLMKTITDRGVEFDEAAEKLITAVLIKQGWRTRVRPVVPS